MFNMDAVVVLISKDAASRCRTAESVDCLPWKFLGNIDKEKKIQNCNVECCEQMLLGK